MSARPKPDAENPKAAQAASPLSARPDGTDPAGDRLGHRDWLRLQTLVLVRWAAISGQLAAIFVAWQVYGVQLPLGACLLAVGAAVIVNLISTFVFPGNTRLTQLQTLATLLFDVGQLALLLALTGGLNNPFAVLILAPVTIGATVLRSRAALVLCLATLAFITLTAVLKLPLRLADGGEIHVPALFEFGFWLALVIGTTFLSAYAHRVSSEAQSMSQALLATQMALAREQKLTDLGGVVAAAAHELGTPLATIKLVSSELADELDDPDLRADAQLIRAQADRCRDILRSMGRAGKDDLHLRAAPLMAVLREAAEPHADRGITLILDETEGPTAGKQPMILRKPEVIHGLRNLIQNAVDFAQTTVWIEAEWSDRRVALRICDDGPGYPAHLLTRIGDPFMRSRRGDPERPGYEGMGLGLFIAKTLLERTGAELGFANGADPFLAPGERPARSGAIVTLSWPRDRIEAPADIALGQNRPFQP